jgi:hypothetical protein
LEAVRQRNRPTAPVKPPPQAPFFLPTLRGADGLVPAFLPGTTPFAAVGLANEKPKAPTAAAGEEAAADPPGWGDAWSDDEGATGDGGGPPSDDEGSSGGKSEAAVRAAALTAAAASRQGFDVATAGGGSKLLRQTKPLELSRGRLAELLNNGGSSLSGGAVAAGSDRAMALLKAMGPSAVDAELQSLCRGDASFHDAAGVELLGHALRWLASVLESRVDFEAAQAYLHRFLRLHAEAIAAALATPSPAAAGGAEEVEEGAAASAEGRRAALAAALRRAEVAQTGGARHLRELLQQNLCLIQFFSNAQPF